MKRKLEYQVERFKKRYCNHQGTHLQMLGLEIPIDTDVFSSTFETVITDYQFGRIVSRDSKQGTCTTTGIYQERKIILDKTFFRFKRNGIRDLILLHEMGHYCLHYASVSENDKKDELFLKFFDPAVLISQFELVNRRIKLAHPDLKLGWAHVDEEQEKSKKLVREWKTVYPRNDARLDCWSAIDAVLKVFSGEDIIEHLLAEYSIMIPCEIEADLFVVANTSFEWYSKQTKRMLYEEAGNLSYYGNFLFKLENYVYQLIGKETMEAAYRL